MHRRTFWLFVQVSCGCFVGGLLTGAVGIVLVARTWRDGFRWLSLPNAFLTLMFAFTASGVVLSLWGLLGTWKRRLEEGDRNLAAAALALNAVLTLLPSGVWLWKLMH